MAVNGIGRPTGTKNPPNARPWSEAIKRAVARRGKQGLNSLADKLLQKVEEGDMQAIKEFGDRYEGKIPQVNKVEGSEPDGSHKLIVEIVRFSESK